MLEFIKILEENYPLLMLAAGVFLVFLLCFMYYWMRILRGSQEVDAQRQQTRADMADVMLVFQTMRDVVQKQKTLARDFNRELDQKTSLVKRILQQSMEKNERLYEKQEALSQELMAARQDLSRLKYQMQQASAAPQPRATQPAQRSTTPPVIKPPVRTVSTVDTIPPESVERLKNTGLTQSPAQTWRGEDLAAAKASPPPAQTPRKEQKLDFIVPNNPAGHESTGPSPADSFKEIIDQLTTGNESGTTFQDPYHPDPEPALPGPQEAPEAAQEAYRALLNIPGNANGNRPPETMSNTPTNGHEHTAQLRQHVIEYNHAGMPIGEIASELGIGKGEVRLILSLSQDTRP